MSSSKQDFYAGTLLNQTVDFENALALFFYTHNHLLMGPLKKIMAAIEQLIKLNEDNPSFDRALFVIFSQLSDDFPNITNVSKLQQSQDFLATISFLKFFCELILSPDSKIAIKYPQRVQTQFSTSIPSLALITSSIFYQKPKEAMQILTKQIRVSKLFAEQHRGALSINCEHPYTKHFGIIAHADLSKTGDFFKEEHYSAQLEYTPNSDSFVNAWLSSRSLPVISGTSGSAEILLTRIPAIVDLTNTEQEILLLANAVSTIAHGHHSFFENMLVGHLFGFSLNDTEYYKDFYLQCIPTCLHSSAQFQEFLAQNPCCNILQTLVATSEEQPSLTALSATN